MQEVSGSIPLSSTTLFGHQSREAPVVWTFPAREAVQDGLMDDAAHGRGDVKKLAGREGFRLRIGPYRIIFAEDQTTVLAVYVGRRATTTYRKT